MQQVKTDFREDEEEKEGDKESEKGEEEVVIFNSALFTQWLSPVTAIAISSIPLSA